MIDKPKLIKDLTIEEIKEEIKKLSYEKYVKENSMNEERLNNLIFSLHELKGENV